MFLRYVSIGVLNTLLHWVVFLLLFYLLGMNQGLANLFAFLTAVTLSFFMNARFTFNKNPTGLRYFLFIVFMGILSYLIGSTVQYLDLYPIFTLILFSGLSLVLGYLYSKLVVFR
ncbi:GtrA family protein [Ignatzschineria cameli]|uniref:Bactoprenol-linked glucose translocase n=1 Tax=Ignatzschineria cameli TaxID=2182793 RepID=A0ABX5KY35_9GAMM|nr:GtrA family protein [Ignatzschineria cameli]PWD88628.1 translocase [Ignatzschineria cameli]PWD88790.1 translocase [Ignatzschineria cameli]PWD90194.1 translocase [Ignatzschineria cameli]